jgi:hypothetical protein
VAEELRHAPETGPVLAPSNASPAASSSVAGPEDTRFHIYEANPAPWWIAALWIGFFVFAVVYLLVNLIE